MRRIFLLVVGVLALAIAAPSVASAHGHHGHRHHHKHKAKHARVKHFAGKANVDPAGPAGPGDAGTVASFDQGTGMLTITLADGSSVSGKVTADTNVNCMAAGQTASHDDNAGDDQGGDDQGDNQGGGDQGDNQGGGDQGGQAACDTSDLVAGAVVHEAILKLGSNGAEFKLVLLDQHPTS
ncbi:MAG: hypothetical protein JSS99_04770 [Actinobacteria bacterium]|nr:hypothetical protein [Actinomycetota bacterium]